MTKFPISFHGDSKTRGEYEALALQRVDAGIREKEADLFGSKWFDYRLQHPCQSTYYYTHCYIVAARNFCRMNNDANRADSLKIFGTPDIFGSRDLTSCVNARQGLDRIGCRYEWALGWMIKRHSDRGWNNFPRPNQLYAEELMLDVRDAWLEECKTSLQIARDPHFQISAADALQPVQAEYVEWLRGQVVSRTTTDAWRPLSRLLKEGVMTRAYVTLHFGEAVLQRALRAAGLSP